MHVDTTTARRSANRFRRRPHANVSTTSNFTAHWRDKQFSREDEMPTGGAFVAAILGQIDTTPMRAAICVRAANRIMRRYGTGRTDRHYSAVARTPRARSRRTRTVTTTKTTKTTSTGDPDPEPDSSARASSSGGAS